MTSVTPTHSEWELSSLVRRLWRAMVRATRAAHSLPSLPESQVTVLQRLAASGPMPPARLADALNLARPTVSNLVRDLVASGLLERRSSPTDGRSVLLVLTPRAEEILTTFRRGRVEVIAQAMAELPASDSALIVEAMPALARLMEVLEAGTSGPR